MQIMFHDILENTSVLFATTSERPTSTVIVGYLNEAQNRFFNERYLSGDVLQNISIAKSLKTELKNMLVTKTLKLIPIDTYSYTYQIEEPKYALVDGQSTIESFDTWEEFEYYVEGTIKVRRTTVLVTEHDFIELLPINVTNLNKYITNFTNVPILPQPVILIDNGLSSSPAMVITDTYTRILNKAITNGIDYPAIYGGDGVTPIVGELNKGTFAVPRSAGLSYSEAYLVVLKRPTTLSIGGVTQDCDLDKRFHEQIVRLAVELFLQDKGKFARQSQEPKQ